MKDAIQSLLISVLAQMGVTGVAPDVTISDDARNGEYTTNIAMKLAKSLKKSPMEIALQVVGKVNSKKLRVKSKEQDLNNAKEDQKISGCKTHNKKLQGTDDVLRAIDRVEAVAPGFINVFLSEAVLSSQISEVLNHAERYGKSQTLVSLDLRGEADGNAKRIMVEFAHPNTHKAFHIGHLRNITTGESIVRLLEATGHEVVRANYQGDVGMHIAKCLWAMTHLTECDPASVRGKDIHVRVEFLGKAYAAGSTRYEADEAAKKETGEINKQIYAKDPAIYPLYQETRAWSLEYFTAIYERVNTHYDRFYFESEFYELGKKYVAEGVKKGIFEESDGAIIFPGEKYNLHNRVFITKEKNATYEGKEIGLGRVQFDEHHPDLIMHVVGPEQAGYFQVLFAALAHMFPDTKGKEYHKVYGWVKLKHGKMSSRTGQVVLGEWLLDEAKRSIYEILKQSRSEYTDAERDEIAEKGAVAAVKYAFLRVGTDQEISFDLKESVSFDGDSGPYLLYTYARCMSVINKAMKEKEVVTVDMALNPEERALARLLYFYPEIVAGAASNLAPNTLCTYLFRLASVFNLFYQKHTIVGAPIRHKLTVATAQVLHNGLYLLGIETAKRM